MELLLEWSRVSRQMMGVVEGGSMTLFASADGLLRDVDAGAEFFT